jgi:hypothetical protein
MGNGATREPPPRPSSTLLKRQVVSRWEVVGGAEEQGLGTGGWGLRNEDLPAAGALKNIPYLAC